MRRWPEKGVGMGHGKYILIVEDEEILAGNLKAYLEKRGCTVRLALDGASGIALAGEFKPEFVVLDYRLPDMSAFTVGLEYGWGKPASPWRVGVEYYQQNPREPGNKFGELANQTLAPSVNAIMLRFNKTF